MAFYSNGVQTNPGVNTVLADSGAMPMDSGGTVFVVISSTAAVNAAFEIRDNANGATVVSHTFFLGSSSTVSAPFLIQLQAGQRMRLITTLAVLGSADGSLTTEFI